MGIRIKKLIDLWVHFKFETLEFDLLFAEDHETAELRESLLPDFFIDINKLYWERILITIARLLDPYEQRRNFNLSLFALPAILKEQGLGYEQLELEITNLKNEYQDIVEYRMKHLAHYDKSLSIGDRELGTSTHFDEVNSFLDKMLELINKTLVLLNLPKESGIVMYPAHHRGSQEFLNILREELNRRKSEED